LLPSSISIACWVVVFSPQIIENFRRGSADGLSLLFLIVWLAGDVFNILGAVLQGVLPTMIILAVYYTLADIVLLGQCFYYRGFTLWDELTPAKDVCEEEEENGGRPTERSALLRSDNGKDGRRNSRTNGHPSSSSSHPPRHHPDSHRRQSVTSFRERLSSLDGTHLSPATPFVDPSAKPTPARPPSTLQTIVFNTFSIALVCMAGVLGWYVSSRSSATDPHDKKPDPPTFDPVGQLFGYLCAALYLGSRLPQLLLNFRRKSTEGVSLLFFLFACIGNLTYVLSIFAYSPVCQDPDGHCQPGEVGAIYGKYILVNLSWLMGSMGTLLLDMAIFVQFFLYRKNNGDESDNGNAEGNGR